MHNLKSISITQPCHQSWQNMNPVKNGRHCNQCSKMVMDFTKMSNDEILIYLSMHQSVCGRFDDLQLAGINRRLSADDRIPIPAKIKGWALVMSLLGSVSFLNACAQVPAPVVQTVVAIKQAVCGKPTLGKVEVSRTIRGQVTDERGVPVPGATISLQSLDYHITTDINGHFMMEVPYSVKEFMVNMIGYEPKLVTVNQNQDLIYNIKVHLSQQLLGEVVVTEPPFFKRMYYKLVKRPIRKLFK